MRDPEERTRHFIIKKKKEEENFDEPSVRRISAQHNDYTLHERIRAGEDEKDNLREGFFARYSAKGKPKDRYNDRSKVKRDDDDEEYYEEFEEDEEEDEGKKAPLLVRIFAWIALLAIFFVCGYLGANYFFNWADKKGGPRVGNVVGSVPEAERVSVGSSSNSQGNVKYNLYIPDGTAYAEREIEIKKGMAEEDIEKVASVYIDGLKETKMLDNNVSVLNVFRSGDWLYLDMTGAFNSSLKALGKDKAALVITGLVRTMRDNFPPVKKIKFYIDGKESGEKTPADLTKPWEIN